MTNAFIASSREGDTGPGAGTKQCSSCGELRNFAMFSSASKSSRGLHYVCKPCDALSGRELRALNALKRRSQPLPAVKHCPKCMLTRPDNEFCKSSNGNDGLNWACNRCTLKGEVARRLQRKQLFKGNLPVAPAAAEIICMHCMTAKPWADMSRDLGRPFGIRSACKNCLNMRRTALRRK